MSLNKDCGSVRQFGEIFPAGQICENLTKVPSSLEIFLENIRFQEQYCRSPAHFGLQGLGQNFSITAKILGVGSRNCKN